MATNIPPHNLREVIDATIAYIDDPDDRRRRADAAHQGPGLPDRRHDPRPRRASATPTRPAAAACASRRAAHIEPLTQGKEAIIVTELPYQVKKGGDGGLIQKIADLVHEKKITEISDLRDESDRHGMRLVIELKRDAIPKVVLNKLYKHTPMQTTFGVNMVALVDNVPRTLTLREVIRHYVDHQREVIVRRTKHELRSAEARAHILEGLLIALDNLDEVIALIRGSRDREAARERPDRALRADRASRPQAILDLRLRRLTALEADKIKQEHADLDRADRGAARDPRRRGRACSASIKEELQRDRRRLRRRAPHARSRTPRARSTSRT